MKKGLFAFFIGWFLASTIDKGAMLAFTILGAFIGMFVANHFDLHVGTHLLVVGITSFVLACFAVAS